MNSMTAPEIIRKKRDGGELSRDEIHWLVNSTVDQSVPSYQTAAWLMATFFRGLSEAETLELCRAFLSSGKVLDFSGLPNATVDKHSTGGVGDKTSLVVAPLVAASGLFVPMISGRGLGHTGGTLDKLESIPGFRTRLSEDEFSAIVERHGVAIMGATEALAPADRIFYALRDVTATIECIPLICASILSKKAAAGVENLVLDVKTGPGAFMQSLEASRNLATNLVHYGRLLGIRTYALITDMTQPLGRCVGNFIEVLEALEILEDRGPSDLRRVCVELAAAMIHLGDGTPLPAATEKVDVLLRSGAARDKFFKMVEAQGGETDLRRAEQDWMGSVQIFDYTSDSAGCLCRVDAGKLGRFAMALGAGRSKADDPVDPAVGVRLYKKLGDSVEKGESLVRVYYRDQKRFERAYDLLSEALEVDSHPQSLPPLICETVS